MANRFGSHYDFVDNNDEDVEINNLSSEITTTTTPTLTTFISTWSPVQSKTASMTSSASASTYITPENTAFDTRPKYEIKPGSMSDKRLKREREKRFRKRRKALSTTTCPKSSKNKFPPEHSDVTTSQTTMTQAVLTYSHIRKNIENDRKLQVIESKPHIFDPRDEVPDKELVSISRFQEQCEFEAFLEKEKKRSEKEEENYPTKKKKKTLLQDPNTYCDGCQQLPGKCHNLQYGRYCVDAVRAYYYTNKELDIQVEEIVARKIFIDHYNYACHFSNYQVGGKLNAIGWRAMPRCLERFSYSDIVGWFNWKSVGGWLDKKEKLPPTWEHY